MPGENTILPKVIAFCSRYGYVYKGFATNTKEGIGRFDYGPFGVGLRHNMCKEWWYSMVTSQESIHGTESPIARQGVQAKDIVEEGHHKQNDHKDSDSGQLSPHGLHTSLYQGTLLHYLRTKDLVNKQLPFGTAQQGVCFREVPSCLEERFIYNSVQSTQLSVQFYCSSKSTTQWMDSWQQVRLEWWRKFAENPSYFSAADLQTTNGVQTVDIQYRFPWGTDTIETIYNHGKGPVEELQTWMDRGGEECRRNLSGSADNYSQTNADVVERQMQVVDLRARDGRKNVLPHTLEMTSDLERGMMAYLLDGYCEKTQPKSTRGGKKNLPVEIMNLHARLAPFKVAITIKSASSDQKELNVISQYLQGEFMKADIGVLVDNSTHSLTEKSNRFDAMGVLFLIVLHEPTIKEGTVVVRSRGENIPHGKHISQVKEFVQKHLAYV